jgi:membrane protein YdbS with pleckstrin-like domain
MSKKFIFNKTSIMLFILGIILLITGYLFMAAGDITVSPILLIIAYIIVFPLAILVGIFRKNYTQKKEEINEKS